MHNQNRIGIADGILKPRKTLETCKNFGKLSLKVWADAFHNYTIILVSFFGKEVPNLHSALAEFNTKI